MLSSLPQKIWISLTFSTSLPLVYKIAEKGKNFKGRPIYTISLLFNSLASGFGEEN